MNRYMTAIRCRSILSPVLSRALPPARNGVRYSSSDSRPSSPLATFNILKPSDNSLKTFASVGNNTSTIGGMKIPGPVFVVNNSIFMWDVPQFGVGLSNESETMAGAVDDPSSVFHGWTPKYFQFLELLEPSPDILVIGSGAQMFLLPPALKSYLHSLGLQIEVQSSRNAAATFNFLLTEGRNPAAAILPVIPTSAKTGQPLVTLSSSRQ